MYYQQRDRREKAEETHIIMSTDLDKGAKQFNGAEMAFLTNGTETVGHPLAIQNKNKKTKHKIKILTTNLTSYTKFNSKWITT